MKIIYYLPIVTLASIGVAAVIVAYLKDYRKKNK
jgi:hypothetical protein